MQGYRKIPMRTGVPADWGIRGAGAALINERAERQYEKMYHVSLYIGSRYV